MDLAARRSPLADRRRMSAREALRRSEWARAVSAPRSFELPHGIAARTAGAPGLFAPAAFDRLYGIGATALWVVDAAEPSVTLVALFHARSMRALLTRMLGGAADVTPSDAPLDELEAGAAHLAASKLLRETFGGSLRLGAVLTESGSIRGALGSEVWDYLGLELDLGEQSHRVELLRRGALPPSSPRRRRTISGDVALPVSLSAGFSRLTLGELSSLARGDVLLLEDAPHGEAYLHVPGTRFARLAKVTGHRVEITTPVELAPPNPTLSTLSPPGEPAREARPIDHPREPTMNDEITRPLDDAQVDVSAELARVRMRVGEIERLAEGEVLHLGVGVGEAIVLRAGDAVIARGELVEVDGRLGVLIRALGA